MLKSHDQPNTTLSTTVNVYVDRTLISKLPWPILCYVYEWINVNISVAWQRNKNLMYDKNEINIQVHRSYSWTSVSWSFTSVVSEPVTWPLVVSEKVCWPLGCFFTRSKGTDTCPNNPPAQRVMSDQIKPMNVTAENSRGTQMTDSRQKHFTQNHLDC